MNESRIQNLLIEKENVFSFMQLVACNVYFYQWESDVLMIDKSGLAIEFEIKISKWDYLKDKDKFAKHRALASAKNFSDIPSKFYYVVLDEFVKDVLVEDYCGLIVVSGSGMKPRVTFEKYAPELHNEPISSGDYKKLAIKLSRKLYL